MRWFRPCGWCSRPGFEVWSNRRDGFSAARHSEHVVLASVRPSSQQFAPEAAAVSIGSEATKELNVAALYTEYFDFVWRSVRRLGVRPSQLEDAVQDVFVVVQRRLSDFEGRSSVKTWLFGIALRVAKDYRQRAAKRCVELVEFDDTVVGKHRDPQQAALETEAAQVVQSALERLSEERRVVFIMAELEDFTAPEIAESLGLGINVVYSRLRLARRDFGRALRGRTEWKQP